MAAIGCLAPLFLLVGGALLGHIMAGAVGGLWGAGLGFGSGIVVLGGFLWLSAKMKSG
ncbi:hypothetical protein SAMN02745172_01356 [Pseudoxanthobacter soli DSM 19599]|uniref:Uncharacterized protein n=1 Tax=Pseudoxanthobacter soli DSM 19599 TaxID=1123029 RepID=A0A1M7ZEX0_9HYPH|nr:hypothetical protein [Pseudoxanthobacter soli]SHO63359.1 hypothetical protein SAMN02745172_01356 [Pseudoxanthobacter soli DSM 19599]